MLVDANVMYRILQSPPEWISLPIAFTKTLKESKVGLEGVWAALVEWRAAENPLNGCVSTRIAFVSHTLHPMALDMVCFIALNT